MARFGVDQDGRGRLELRTDAATGDVEGIFFPTPSRLTPIGVGGIKMLSLSPSTGALSIHPINTLEGTDGYLGPKYSQIVTLTLHVADLDGYLDESDFERLLDVLPKGFVKDYNYGLGLLQDCNRLVRLIEENTPCNEVVFDGSTDAVVEESVFRLGLSRFAKIWTELERINSRGNRAAGRVKDAFVHNNLSEPLILEEMSYSLGRHPDSGLLAKAAEGAEEFTANEQDVLLGTVAAEASVLARALPEKFMRLRREVELVSLDRLIEAYAEALDKNAKEGFWQAFFNENKLALQQVFGAPMVSVQSGANVGGSALAGEGGKIADYLYKNSLTNNVALVEIKKPTTQLLGKREYRSGVFAASAELNGAITQVLDQAHQLSTNFLTLKNNSDLWELKSYSVACFVVAGRTPPAEEPARQKSFELYRANSSTVTIVTYDEILERLRQLREFLAPVDSAAS